MTEKIGVSYWAADVTISEEEWNFAETEGKILLSDHHREQILAKLNEYHFGIVGWRNAIRPNKEFRKLLKDVEASAKALSDALHRATQEHDGAAASQLELSALRLNKDVNISDIRKSSIWMAQLAQNAISNLPSDKGAGGDPFIGDLLVALEAIYRQAGGSGTYGDAAKRFLRFLTKKAGSTLASMEALEQRLKEARRERGIKASSDAKPPSPEDAP
jgi:hypothetical protein